MKKKNRPTVTFFTYANKKYYHFVLPYIYSILKNTDADVEIAVENELKFFNLYGKKLANLKHTLGNNLALRTNIYGRAWYTHSGFTSSVIPNTQRFVLCPHYVCEDYTYITDCDMIITKDKYKKAIENNIQGMKKNNTCFFNIKRPNREVLSGIHFVKNSEYYPKIVQFIGNLTASNTKDTAKVINAMGDEGFLYNMVMGIWGDPGKLTEGNERILPGDHLSPNRGKTYTAIKDELCKDGDWKYAFTQFDKKFLAMF